MALPDKKIVLPKIEPYRAKNSNIRLNKKINQLKLEEAKKRKLIETQNIIIEEQDEENKDDLKMTSGKTESTLSKVDMDQMVDEVHEVKTSPSDSKILIEEAKNFTESPELRQSKQQQTLNQFHNRQRSDDFIRSTLKDTVENDVFLIEDQEFDFKADDQKQSNKI